jgi:hypothetical protein
LLDNGRRYTLLVYSQQAALKKEAQALVSSQRYQAIPVRSGVDELSDTLPLAVVNRCTRAGE